MSTMKGFITAAGMGKRFGAVTRNKNKGMLTVEEKPLLCHSLEKLRDVGIDDILVAVGYEAAQIRAQVEGYAQTVLNPFYAVSGILGSFWVAHTHLRGVPFLFTTSDHYYCKSVLHNCVTSGHDICIVVQEKPSYSKEDSKVIIRDGKIIDLGKHLPVDEANGEFGGMAFFSARASEAFFQVLQNMLEMGMLHGYVTDVLKRVAVEHQIPIQYSVCYDGSRIEIDSVHDLREARNLIINSEPL